MLQKQQKQNIFEVTTAISNCDYCIERIQLAINSDDYQALINDFDTNIVFLQDKEFAKDLISKFEKAKRIRNEKVAKRAKPKATKDLKLTFYDMYEYN
jgi:hypothetical protein